MTIITFVEGGDDKVDKQELNSEPLLTREEQPSAPHIPSVNAQQAHLHALNERRRRRLRLAVICSTLLSIGTLILALFYIYNFFLTYQRAVRKTSMMCGTAFVEPDESANDILRVYPPQSQIANAGSSYERGRRPMLLGRPDGHEGGMRPPWAKVGRFPERISPDDSMTQILGPAETIPLDDGSSEEMPSPFESRSDSEEWDMFEKKHKKRKNHTTTTKPATPAMRRQDLQERISIIDSQHAQLVVPQLHSLRSASILHDFQLLQTAIVDGDQNRCFIKPLSKAMTVPPRSFLELYARISTGFYMPDMEAVRAHYRVRSEPMTRAEIDVLGEFIGENCRDKPTYKLEPMYNVEATPAPLVSGSGVRVRRSVAETVQEFNMGAFGHYIECITIHGA